MNILLANFSTDLRRISYWAYEGRTNLVKDNIDRIRLRYQGIKSVGVYPNIWYEINKIENNDGGNYRSADRAATLGSMLLQESYKK